MIESLLCQFIKDEDHYRVECDLIELMLTFEKSVSRKDIKEPMLAAILKFLNSSLNHEEVEPQDKSLKNL